MLRRLLVLLGESPSSVAARRYAFRLARAAQADLSGLAGVDLTTIEAPMLGRVGASAFKAALEDQLRKQADDARKRLHDSFEKECGEEGVAFAWQSFEGDPLDALGLATETRDLVVTGHDTVFYGESRPRVSDMLAKLLLTSPRPVVVCPDELRTGKGTMIAYDGSFSAMRAVQMFALLQLERDNVTRVVSVDSDQSEAARRASAGASYLRSHGYRVEAVPIGTRVDPTEALKIEIEAMAPGNLVIGAYGHRGFREMLFGSTSSHLVEDPPCALFMYH